MSNAATRIIEKFGGSRRLAKLLGLDASAVYRWTYQGKKGAGGAIPTRHQNRLLQEAAAHGIDLSPADFFDLPDDMREAS